VTDYAAATVAHRSGRPAAWWGMLMLVASEGVLFGAFVGTFFYLRFNDPAWPPPGDPKPKVVVPLILVAVLTATAPLIAAARRAAGRGRVGAVRALLVAALVVQSGYFAYEVHDFADQIRESPISTDAYTSIHYVLLGADHAHVFVGILFDLWLLWKLTRGLTAYRSNALQAIALYWYFVVALTWIVTGAVLSAAVG
jgi:heme/copper-type cytochrome/quinol oxidase subunit 3